MDPLCSIKPAAVLIGIVAALFSQKYMLGVALVGLIESLTPGIGARLSMMLTDIVLSTLASFATTSLLVSRSLFSLLLRDLVGHIESLTPGIGARLSMMLTDIVLSTLASFATTSLLVSRSLFSLLLRDLVGLIESLTSGIGARLSMMLTDIVLSTPASFATTSLLVSRSLFSLLLRHLIAAWQLGFFGQDDGIVHRVGGEASWFLFNFGLDLNEARRSLRLLPDNTLTRSLHVVCYGDVLYPLATESLATMITLNDYMGKRSLLVAQFPTVLVKHIEETVCPELKRRHVSAFRTAFLTFVCCVIAFMVLTVIVHVLLRRLGRLVFKQIAVVVIASSVPVTVTIPSPPSPAFTTSVQLGTGSENKDAKLPTAAVTTLNAADVGVPVGSSGAPAANDRSGHAQVNPAKSLDAMNAEHAADINGTAQKGHVKHHDRSSDAVPDHAVNPIPLSLPAAPPVTFLPSTLTHHDCSSQANSPLDSGDTTSANAGVDISVGGIPVTCGEKDLQVEAFGSLCINLSYDFHHNLSERTIIADMPVAPSATLPITASVDSDVPCQADSSFDSGDTTLVNDDRIYEQQAAEAGLIPASAQLSGDKRPETLRRSLFLFGGLVEAMDLFLNKMETPQFDSFKATNDSSVVSINKVEDSSDQMDHPELQSEQKVQDEKDKHEKDKDTFPASVEELQRIVNGSQNSAFVLPTTSSAEQAAADLTGPGRRRSNMRHASGTAQKTRLPWTFRPW
ncbi:hypothetical protein BU17DRAFT_104026 [Hysterangium stoloniferum]|nr:hypothetical protein BU17DRAFT_104026 [Hysterangium stoloniferum]